METQENESVGLSPLPAAADPSFRNRVTFLIMLILVCSSVGGYLGGHYGQTRNVQMYSGPRVAHGQVITSGEIVAGFWGLAGGLLLGSLFGVAALVLRWRIDVSPVKCGIITGTMVGFLAGFIGGTSHSWISPAIVGLAASAIIGLIGYTAAD